MSIEYYGCHIHTNKYSGNFERNMATYITGLESCSSDQRLMELAERELEPNQYKWFEDNLFCHGEYDDIVSVAITPGWCNDGYGRHVRGNKYKYPAYQSIELRFDTEPTSDIRELIEERARKFAADNDIEIENIEFFSIELVFNILSNLPTRLLTVI